MEEIIKIKQIRQRLMKNIEQKDKELNINEEALKEVQELKVENELLQSKLEWLEIKHK